MRDRSSRILPAQLALEVEMYVDSELEDAKKYDNRQPLDESGVYDLHTLAARIYAAGWDDGERTEGERQRRGRARQNARAEATE